MLQSIWDDVKREFSFGNAVTRIIIINVAVFVILNLLWVGFRIAYQWPLNDPEGFLNLKRFFLISSDWIHNLTHPWVIISHAFVHQDFWHILWNMLLLYWFGRIVGDFIGDQRIIPLYLLGAIFGGLAYVLTINFLPYSPAVTNGEISYAEGASAAVMAIIVAAGTISPDYIMRLLFLGDVRLKYIVATLVFLDIIGIGGNFNTGGHFGHLGGALFGYLFVRQLREGNDWSIPVNNLLDRIGNFFKSFTGGTPKPKKGPRMVYKNPVRTKKTHGSKKGNAASDREKLSHQEQLDAILDKISQFGYESLSEEEKEFLFNASKK